MMNLKEVQEIWGKLHKQTGNLRRVDGSYASSLRYYSSMKHLGINPKVAYVVGECSFKGTGLTRKINRMSKHGVHIMMSGTNRDVYRFMWPRRFHQVTPKVTKSLDEIFGPLFNDGFDPVIKEMWSVYDVKKYDNGFANDIIENAGIETVILKEERRGTPKERFGLQCATGWNIAKPKIDVMIHEKRVPGEFFDHYRIRTKGINICTGMIFINHTKKFTPRHIGIEYNYSGSVQRAYRNSIFDDYVQPYKMITEGSVKRGCLLGIEGIGYLGF